MPEPDTDIIKIEEKKTLTLEGLADILRKNCEGFDEEVYNTIDKIPSSAIPYCLSTKHLVVEFGLNPNKTVASLSIGISGRPNYDPSYFGSGVVWSDVAKTIAQNNGVLFRDGKCRYCFNLDTESLEYLEPRIQDVYSAQKQLNEKIEKERTRIFHL